MNMDIEFSVVMHHGELPPVEPPTSASGRVRSAFVDGYSLHADRLVDEADRDGLERVCRWCAIAGRQCAALARSEWPSGRVVLSLKRPVHDGQTEIAFIPIEFLRRLVTLISATALHLTRYHGVFAPNHHLRARARRYRDARKRA